MQRIQVHPDQLEEKARLVQQKKQELERMVRELEKSIYMLQSEWSGLTGERFFWDFMQVKEVFPATLGLLDKIQNEFIFIAKNFRTADGSGEVALYIPEELKRNFGVGLLDKSIGETVTGIGQTAEALFYDPFGTVASVAYGLTLGKVVDVGRGIKFAWDAAWGNGTARSDVGQFVDEQKKQVGESGAGYYSGSVMGQVLAYAFVGKALRSVENKHSDLGGSGGKTNSGKGKEGPGKVDLTEPTLSPGGKPKGKYEKPDPNDPNPITFQNEAADLLASKGYDIDMLPNTKGGNGYGINPTSNPDFLINGKAFDCYSPETLKVRNIWATVMKKTEEQTGRIVMNLDGYKGSMDELYEQFNKYEISTLSELIYIKDGQITRLKP